MVGPPRIVTLDAVWRVSRVASTASTNADVAGAARAGEPEGYVLVADEQTAGRGRLGRSWSSPPGTSLSVSVLLRPAGPPATMWSWLPLLVGVATVEAVRAVSADDAVLKWPNDVLRDGRKLAGILVERVETPVGPAAVAGVGMNLAAAPEHAASLVDTGASRDRVLDAALSRVPESEPVVLFTHNPDIFPQVPARVSLTVAGPTHGGQVYLPGLGRPIVPSEYGERFAIGHVVEDGRHLFVSPGLGTSILPVRFLVPPEVSVLRLLSRPRPIGSLGR